MFTVYGKDGRSMAILSRSCDIRGWSFDAYVFGVRATPDDAYETGKLTPPSASANRLRRTTNRNHTINPVNGHGLIQKTRSWRITASSIPFDIHITGLRHLINPL